MKALIRADASVEIGMGHHVRCQALIRAFEQLGWQCQFVVLKQYADFVDSQAIFIDKEMDFLLLVEQVDLVILDHTDYLANDIVRLFQRQPNLLVLDDMNVRGRFPAKWLLNPLTQTYSVDIEHSLSGGQFALLRPQFCQTRRDFPPETLLVTLGGTDPLALTLPILETLEKYSFPLSLVRVLLGKNAANSEQVIAYCERNQIAWQQGVSDVASLMRQAKMAISAAGSTLFELAFMGVPTIFAQVADNQTRSLEQHVPLGWCESVRFDDINTQIDRSIQKQRTEQRLEQLINKLMSKWQDEVWLKQAQKVACSLVDGHGAKRVAGMIHQALS